MKLFWAWGFGDLEPAVGGGGVIDAGGDTNWVDGVIGAGPRPVRSFPV
jgi:hypothetical protein